MAATSAPLDICGIPHQRGQFTIWRQDTHGNKTSIASGVSKNFADAVIEKLEENVHKQAYWASRMDDSESPTP